MSDGASVGSTRIDTKSGHLFVFTSRRCDPVKILAWDAGGRPRDT